MSFDPSKDCFGTGLSASVKRAQKWRAQTLLHESALLPFPLAAAFALGVVGLGIGPALRRTQDQKAFSRARSALFARCYRNPDPLRRRGLGQLAQPRRPELEQAHKSR